MSEDVSPLLRLLRSPWPLALALFIGSLALFTRDNTFSFDYHPDEDGKVYQIIHRERNFHHPLLLLNVTDLAVHLAGVSLNSQPVVIVGRWVSAAFAAGAVVALALVAFLRAGSLAAWTVGLLAATHGKLYEAAHYLKEDTALVFGLALFFLAAECFLRSPGERAVRFLGLACAAAVGGKYVGLLVLPFALVLVWCARKTTPTVQWRPFATVFAVTFVVINLPPTFHPSSPIRSLEREVVGVSAGHRGMTRGIPHAKYFPELRDDVPLPLLAASGLALVMLVATARRRSGAEWTLVLFPIVFFAMLSCSPKTAGRYLLPVTTLLCAIAGFGVIDLARLLSPIPSHFALGCVAIFLVNAQLPSLRTTIAEFQKDDRIALAAWIAADVPADAIIAEDHRVNLVPPAIGDESGKPHVPQHVLDNDFAADLGTLDEMRSWGLVYVAVSQHTYDRFFSSSLKPRASEKADYERRREFYTRLFAEGELVYELKSHGNPYLQPGLRLYKL